MSALNILGDDRTPPPTPEVVRLYTVALELRRSILTAANSLLTDFSAGPMIDAESDALIREYLANLNEGMEHLNSQEYSITAEVEAFAQLLLNGQLDAKELFAVLTHWIGEHVEIYTTLNQVGLWVLRYQIQEPLQQRGTCEQKRWSSERERAQLSSLKNLNQRLALLEVLLKKYQVQALPATSAEPVPSETLTSPEILTSKNPPTTLDSSRHLNHSFVHVHNAAIRGLAISTHAPVSTPETISQAGTTATLHRQPAGETVWLSGASVLIDTQDIGTQLTESGLLLYHKLQRVMDSLGQLPIRCITTTTLRPEQSDMLKSLAPAVVSIHSITEQAWLHCEILLYFLPEPQLTKQQGEPLRIIEPPTHGEEKSEVSQCWHESALELRVDALTGQRRLNGIDTNLLPEDIMTLLAIGKSLPEDGTYVEIGEPTAVSSTLIGLGVKTANNSSANVYSIHDWRRDRADCELEDTGEFYAFSETLQEAGMDCIVTPLLMTAQKALGLFHEKTIDVLHLNLTSRSLDIAADVPGWLARCKDGARILVSTDLATTAIEALAIEITRTVPLANGANCTKLGWLWEIELLTNA